MSIFDKALRQGYFNQNIDSNEGKARSGTFKGLGTLARPTEYRKIKEQGEQIRALTSTSNLPAAHIPNASWGSTIGGALTHSFGRAVAQGAAQIKGQFLDDGQIENFSIEQRAAADAYAKFNDADKLKNKTLQTIEDLRKEGRMDDATYQLQVNRALEKYNEARIPPELMAILDSKVTKKVGGYGNNSSAMRTEETGDTVAEATVKSIQAADLKRQMAGDREGGVDNVFGTGALTNKGAMASLNADIAARDKATTLNGAEGPGAYDTVANRVAAGLANPKAAVGTFLESSVYMVPGLGQVAAGLDTVDQYENAKRKSIASNGGGMFLGAEDQKRVNQASAFYGVLNTLSAGVAGKMVSGAVSRAAGKEASENIAKNFLTRDLTAGLKNSKAGKVGLSAGIIGAAAIGEGFEEFSQDVAEQIAGNETVDLRAAATGGVLGAFGGGILGATTQAAPLVGKSRDYVTGKVRDKVANSEAGQEFLKNKEVTPENYEDRNHKWYEPAKPINDIGESVKRTDTREDLKAKAEKINAILATTRENKEVAEKALDLRETADRNKVLGEERLVKLDNRLNEELAKPEALRDNVIIGKLKAEYAATQGTLAKIDDTLAKSAKIEDLIADKARMTKAYNQATAAHATAIQKVDAKSKLLGAEPGKTTYSGEAVPTNAEAAATPSTGPQYKKTSFKDKVANIFRSPRTATVAQIEAAIAEETDQDIIATLRKLSAVKQMENAEKDEKLVSRDIRTGNRDQGYLGLADYDDLVQTAIEQDDVGKFNGHMQTLGLFAASHSSKAEAVTKAQAMLSEPGAKKLYTVVREEGTQDWTVTDKPMSKAERTKTGSVEVHKNSGNLIAAIQEEAKLISLKRDTLTELGNFQFDPKNRVAEEAPVVAPKPPKTGYSATGTGNKTTSTKAAKTTIKPPTQPTKPKTSVPAVLMDTTPFKDADARDTHSGNFSGVGKDRKNVANIPDGVAKDYAAVAQGANRFIGFGIAGKGQVGRLREGFAGSNNILTNYPDNTSAVYTDEDTVMVHAVTTSTPSPADIAEKGVRGNGPVAQAQKKEIDGAMAAGATIVMLPEGQRMGKVFSALNDIAAYMTEQGYQEGQLDKGTKSPKRGNGIFTKMEAVNEQVNESQKAKVPAPSVPVSSSSTPTTSNPDSSGKGKSDTSGKGVTTSASKTQAEPTVEETETPTQVEESVDYNLAGLPSRKSVGKRNDATTIRDGLYEADWVHVPIAATDKVATVTEARTEVTGITASLQFKQGNTLLTNIKDVFSNLIRTKDVAKLEEHLDGAKVTDENIKQLDSFIRLHQIFTEALPQAYKESTSLAEKESYLAEAVVNKDGTFDENVVTALTIAAFQYIQSSGHSSTMTKAQVKFLLGMDEKAHMPDSVYKAFKDVGSNRSKVFQELGQTASKSLGIRVTDVAKVTEANALDVSLGQMIYHVLSERDGDSLTTQTQMSVKEKLEIIGASNISSFDFAKVINVYYPEVPVKYMSLKEQKEFIANLNNKASKQIFFTRPNIKTGFKEEEFTTTYQRNVLDILKSSERTDGSVDLLDTLFGLDNLAKAPLMEAPTELSQTKIKGTNQEIPDNQRALLLEAAQNPWAIHQERADTIINLYDNQKDTLYNILGIGTPESVAAWHPTKRDNQIAEWEITKRAIDNKVAWLKSIKADNGKFKNYYMKPVVWVNQRVGYESTLFNAQTNLFDRMLTTMEDWKVNINPKEVILDAEGNATLHGRFLRALAENMEGVSKFLTFPNANYGEAARTVDKVASKDFLPAFETYLNTNEELQAAIKATHKMMEGGALTIAETKAIKDTIDLFKMDEPGLGALMELASYMQAKELGKTYSTMIGTQSDGVTNGPVTTQILYNVANSDIMAMGGILTNNDKDYFEQKARGEQDLYEFTGAAQKSALAAYIGPGSLFSALMGTFEKIDNTFGTRKGAKTLVTPFNYGAGIKRLKIAIEESFLGKISDKFYDLYTMNETEQSEKLAELNAILKTMVSSHNETFANPQIDPSIEYTTLDNLAEETVKLVYIYNHTKNGRIYFNYKDGKPVPVDKLIEKLLELTESDTMVEVNQKLRKNNFPENFQPITVEELSQDFPARFNHIVHDLVGLTWGTASAHAIKDNSAEYIEQRNAVTLVSNTAFALYNVIKQNYINDLGKSPADMTVAEEANMQKALSRYMPAVVSALGNDNRVDGKRKDAVKFGLMLSKDKKVTVDGEPVKSRFYNLDSTKNTQDSQYSAGFQYNTEVEPGVRGMALQIQAVDSYVSVYTVNQQVSINLHDADMGGLNNYIPMTVAQNKAHFNAMVEYDAYVEMVQALLRPLNGLKSMLDTAIENNTSLDVIKATLNEGYGANNDTSLTDFIVGQVTQAYLSDAGKLASLADVKVHHQYAGEDGQYNVTEEDRANILKREERLRELAVKEANRVERMIREMELDITVHENGMDNTVDTRNYIELNEMNYTDTNSAFRDALNNAGTVSITEVVDYIRGSLKESNPSDVTSILDLFDGLNDSSLAGIKVQVAPNQGQAVRYDRLRDTIFVQAGSTEVTIEAMARTVLVAAMHKNTIAYKKGSNKFAHVSEQIKALSLIASNTNTIFDRALKEKAITAAERTYLANTVGKHRGDVEYLMDFVMNDRQGAAILTKVPFYEDMTVSSTNLLDKVIGFIKNIISKDIGSVTNMQSMLFNASTQLLNDIKVNRRDKSINDLIALSYTTHKHNFQAEFNTKELNYWDTRINHELYKAKVVNGGKPLSANLVLDIIENALTNGMNTEVVTDALYRDVYMPIVKMLKQTVGSNTQVVIIDNLTDLDGSGLTEAEIDELSMSGDAFFKDGKAYMFTPGSANSPNTRLSTMLHELMHAATHYNASKPSNSKSMARMAALFEEVQEALLNSGDPEVSYAASSLDEFIANASTLSSVKDFLMGIELKSAVSKKNANEEFYSAWETALGIKNLPAKNALKAFSNLMASYTNEHKVAEYSSPNQDDFTDLTQGLPMALIKANQQGTEVIKTNLLNTAEVLDNASKALMNMVTGVENDSFIAEVNTMMPESNIESVRDLTEQIISDPVVAKVMTSKVNGKGSLYNTYLNLFGENKEAVNTLVTTIAKGTIMRSPRTNQSNSTSRGFRFEPQDIFNYLGTTTTVQNVQLQESMTKVVTPLMDLISPSLVEGYELFRVWQDALNKGEAVFVSDVYSAGFRIDDQEGFVLETAQATLEVMLDEVTDKRAYQDVKKLYQDAKRVLQPSDFHDGNWNEATQEEIEAATTKYNFVFNTPVTGQDKSQYLTRFIALGLASSEFRSVLSRTAKPLEVKRTVHSTFNDILQAIVDFIYAVIDILPGSSNIRNNVSKNDTMAVKLAKLSATLVQVYAKNNDTANINQANLLSNTEKLLEDVTDATIQGLADAMKATANLPFLKDTIVGKVTNLVANDRLEHLSDFVNATHALNNRYEPHGEILQVANEILGNDSKAEIRKVKDYLNLGKFIEQTREKIAETTANGIMKYFHESNQEMGKEARAAITKVMLRTDLQKLYESYSYAEIMNLVRSPSALAKEIKTLEAKLMQVEYGNEYLIRSKALADYMVYRVADTNNLLAKNAYTIAYRYGLSEQPQEVRQEVIGQIDSITTLYALARTKSTDRQLILDINSREVNEVNGLDYTLKTHRTISRQTDKLFEDNPWAKNKGYLPNILNHNKGFEVINREDLAKYIKQGYVQADTVRHSELDNTDGEKILMILPHSGKQRYVSGTLSIEDTVKSGSTILKDSQQEFAAISRKVQKDFENKVNTTNHQQYKRDFDKVGLVPSYNDRGDIISFSYEMSAVGLDSHLERNNDFAHLLGHYAGGTHSRLKQPNNNRKVIDYILDVYEESGSSLKTRFVAVGPKSTNAKAREYWASLPRDTQMYIERQTGEQVLHVRNDMLNTLFGFSKYTPSQAFDKNFKDRAFAEKIYTTIFNELFREEAQLRSNQFIGGWQELIALLKDFEVVRSPDVFAGNILSNVAFSMINDFNPSALVQDIGLATESSLRYNADSTRLSEIELALHNGFATQALLSEYAEVKDSISRNPLRDFIEAGMMPTIVNDVSFAKDDYSYKSGFAKKLESLSNRTPKGVRGVGKFLIMSPDTTAYKFMATATQQSDFVFKYAVYKQELKAGKSKEDAMRFAREMFIEYDVPTSKGMQFVNDMGTFMYTKFAFRIQRVIAHLIKKRGAKILGESIITPLLFGLPSAMSLHLISRLFNGTNPLRMPLDDVLTMLDEAMPLALLMHVLGIGGEEFAI